MFGGHYFGGHYFGRRFFGSGTTVLLSGTFAQALYRELITNGITAPYVAASLNRVYPLIIPQKMKGGPAQTPCVVYTMSGIEHQQTYCRTDRLVRSRWVLDCYSTSYDEAWALAEAVRQVLQDFEGMLGGTVDVRNATLETAIDLQDIDPGLYRVTQSWSFWHMET